MIKLYLISIVTLLSFVNVSCKVIMDEEKNVNFETDFNLFENLKYIELRNRLEGFLINEQPFEDYYNYHNNYLINSPKEINYNHINIDSDNDHRRNVDDIMEDPYNDIHNHNNQYNKPIYDDNYEYINDNHNENHQNIDSTNLSNDINNDNKENINSNINDNDKINTKRPMYQNEWLVHVKGSKKLIEMLSDDVGYEYIGPVIGLSDVHRIRKLRTNVKGRKKRSSNDIEKSDLDTQIIWAEQQYLLHRIKRRTYLEEYNKWVNENYESTYYGNFDETKIRTKREKDEDNQGGTDLDQTKIRSKRESSKNEKQNEELNEILDEIFNEKIKDKNVKEINMLKKNEMLFNDELWAHQWYLFDTRSLENLPKLDLNVLDVWNIGITGNGVKIAILDDGLEWYHTDLIDNYDSELSYDINDDDPDPRPRYDEYLLNSHGTMCAGEIAMKPNNSKCGVGIAYDAKIGGVRMLDGDINDRVEGSALAFASLKADIVTCSWGPSDDGTVVEGPGTLALHTLEEGVNQGRNGLGTIYVWASGNGGYNSDNCNCDGYSSSIYTLSIGSASEYGESPWYGERCSSTLATTYSSGAYTDQKVSSTDLHDKCTTKFSGTSASAPLAAGIIALTLEANPLLTWRDIQHIVVKSSDSRPLNRDIDWKTNHVGLRFNSKFGFGILNAQKMVTLAQNWTTVSKQFECTIFPEELEDKKLKSNLTMDFHVMKSCQIEELEHVQLTTSIQFSNRGCLGITLISPKNTETHLLSPRSNDNSPEGFKNWNFMSVHTWGEDPSGVWRASVSNTCSPSESGNILDVSLKMYGTKKPSKE